MEHSSSTLQSWRLHLVLPVPECSSLCSTWLIPHLSQASTLGALSGLFWASPTKSIPPHPPQSSLLPRQSLYISHFYWICYILYLFIYCLLLHQIENVTRAGFYVLFTAVSSVPRTVSINKSLLREGGREGENKWASETKREEEKECTIVHAQRLTI